MTSSSQAGQRILVLDSLPSATTPGQSLAQIPGAMPSLLALPAGCAFAGRCAHVAADCGAPVDMTTAGDRGWRCRHPLGRISESLAS